MNGRQVPSKSQLADPSAALAWLCAGVYRAEGEGLPVRTWLAQAEHILKDEPILGPPPAERGTSELLRDVRHALGAVAPEKPLTKELMFPVLSALHALDQWHEPLQDPVGQRERLSESHYDALDRLRLNPSKDAGSGYNDPEGFGVVIPPRRRNAARARVRDRGSVLIDILHYVSYLPPFRRAGDPDAADDSGGRDRRPIVLSYRHPTRRQQDGRDPIRGLPVVSVAPVIERIQDAEIELFDNQRRYRVRPTYGTERFDVIFDAAMANDSHILFMPEMSIDAAQLEEMRGALRRSGQRHWARHERKLPELRYVVCGVAGRGNPADAPGRNYIVIVNLEGDILLEQDKLCRWNLTPDQQTRYGTEPDRAPEDGWLKEGIEAGEHVRLIDLQDFGRFLTLICADMNHDEPGDWLIQNLGVDWLHAPIMDKSLAWSRRTDGELEPWIVQRAHRAATRGAERVIVTNSLFFTLRMNITNARPGSRYGPLSHCAVAVMFDGTGTNIRFRQIDVSIPCATPLVITDAWMATSEIFPSADSRGASADEVKPPLRP